MERRGTDQTPKNRFLPIAMELDRSVLDHDESDEPKKLKTEWYWDATQSVVSENQSPDVPFRFSINPYRGCEHGCAYCYARPYHEYLGWNAGTDFESKILVKSDAAKRIRDWLSKPTWNGSEHLNMSGVTDPYQPIERTLRVTRSILEVLAEARQAVSIITKNNLITRDLDFLQELQSHQAIQVSLSFTTLDKELAMVLEPRCSVPEARLKAIRVLSDAGIPVHVNMAPLIPGLTDHEIPKLLEAIADAGAKSVSWILLRLPGAVEGIFVDWLDRHRPDSKQKIVERIKLLRDGKLNDSDFRKRMRGEGFFVDEWRKLFEVMRLKYRLLEKLPPMNTQAFRPPRSIHGQQFLF